jgi:RimJ/RimL family protein N-acetyltransferase
VSVASNTVVGCGGFKGNPTSDGSVEIAYFTFPAYERQGFGTATARELVAVARAAGGLRSAVAHTLPRPSASTRILQRIGFEHVGEALDPEDGRVWHWRLPLA